MKIILNNIMQEKPINISVLRQLGQYILNVSLFLPSARETARGSDTACAPARSCANNFS